MSDGREPDGMDEAGLAEAFRAADAEARPRPEFRDALRARFVAGDLRPAEAPRPPSLPHLALPRWILYPAAAAILAGVVYASGALDPAAVPDPVRPLPAAVASLEAAMRAAEKRVAAVPALAEVRWQHRIVDGWPWLVPATVPETDGKEMKVLVGHVAAADKALVRNLPAVAGRPSAPVVLVVAPTREAFESLVAPLVAPTEVGTLTIAFALPGPGVLLVSPETLSPGGTVCEDMEGMDVVHEAAHAWLHGRAAPGAPALPLWVDEGLAGAASASGYDPRKWCASLIGFGRKEKFDPVTPEEVLSLKDFPSMARLVGSRAPRPEAPHALVPLFYAHAEGLVLFLTDDADPVRRDAFLRWLADRLDGKPTDPAATAKDLGFASVEALFAARDAWLGL